MKVLSIISLIASVFSFLIGFGITQMRCYQSDYSEYGGHTYRIGEAPGIIVIVLSLWFLAFSIVATVVSFKKKTDR